MRSAIFSHMSICYCTVSIAVIQCWSVAEREGSQAFVANRYGLQQTCVLNVWSRHEFVSEDDFLPEKRRSASQGYVNCTIKSLWVMSTLLATSRGLVLIFSLHQQKMNIQLCIWIKTVKAEPPNSSASLLLRLNLSLHANLVPTTHSEEECGFTKEIKLVWTWIFHSYSY